MRMKFVFSRLSLSQESREKVFLIAEGKKKKKLEPLSQFFSLVFFLLLQISRDRLFPLSRSIPSKRDQASTEKEAVRQKKRKERG